MFQCGHCKAKPATPAQEGPPPDGHSGGVQVCCLLTCWLWVSQHFCTDNKSHWLYHSSLNMSNFTVFHLWHFNKYVKEHFIRNSGPPYKQMTLAPSGHCRWHGKTCQIISHHHLSRHRLSHSYHPSGGRHGQDQIGSLDEVTPNHGLPISSIKGTSMGCGKGHTRI